MPNTLGSPPRKCQRLANMLLRPYPGLNVYPASSWRNRFYPDVIAALKDAGHRPYDWKQSGFTWGGVAPIGLGPHADYISELRRGAANLQFRRDINAIDNADVLVLILPAGASAHAEPMRAHDKGKPTVIMLNARAQRDVMHAVADAFVEDIPSLLRALAFDPINDAIEGLRMAP